MSRQFNWTPNSSGAGFVAKMQGAVTLVVTPDHVTGLFGEKPRRGTTWHAQASHWDAATTTMSRFGRDEYGVTHKTFKDAMRAAEAIYRDATAMAVEA